MEAVARRLGIPPDMLEAIFEQARAEWPNECCGVITTPVSSRGSGLRRTACRNVYDRLKERDPEAYPRTAKTAYVIDPEQQAVLDRENREQDRDYFIFYHSHPQHDAYFSEEDIRAATFPFDEPNFPDAIQLVVSVYDRKVKEIYFCRWDEPARTYTGEKIPVG